MKLKIGGSDVDSSGVSAAPRPSAKELVGKALFSLARIERIHIIGCSRSGTTMLHLAMACFSNVILSESESNIQYPYSLERAGLAVAHGWRPGRKFYVTKREPGWFRPEKVAQILHFTRLEKIGLIHLVRDPRDVLLSRHVALGQQPYVTAEHWHKSVAAADHIFGSLADYSRKLTLRYEDLVSNPESAEQMIAQIFGLQRNPSALPINRVKDNFERLRIRFDPTEIRNLSGLRNMDAGSIGRWRHSRAELLPSVPDSVRERFDAFLCEHGYQT